MKRKPILVLLAVVITAVLIFSGCAAMTPSYSTSRDSENVAGAPEAAPQASAAPAAEADAGNGQTVNKVTQAYDPANVPTADQKLIRSASIELTTPSYDADYETIYLKIRNVGGYIEKSSESGKKPEEGDTEGRTTYFLARIPKAQFDSFIQDLGKIGTLVSRNVDSQDVTSQYFDTENSVKLQRTRLELLQKFLTEAKTMEDMLKIEGMINETQLQIEQLTGQLKYYDNQVDFSAVNITLREVVALKNVQNKDNSITVNNAFYGGLNAITAFFEAIGIALAASWPFLLFFGALAAGITWLVIGVKRMKARKKARLAAAAKDKEEQAKTI